MGRTVRLTFASVGFYLKKFLCPYPLSVAINHINILIYSISGTVFLLLYLFIASKKTVSSFLAFWALIGIAPASLDSLTSIAWTPWAERYLYFSLGPLSILTVMAFINIASVFNDQLRQVLFAMGVGLLVIFATTSFSRSLLWNDDLRIWEDTYAKSPGFLYAATGYADALSKKGRNDDAAKVLLNAVELPGPKHVLYLRLGHIYRTNGARSKAEEYYKNALIDARADKDLALVGKSLRKDILLSLAGLYLSSADHDKLDRVSFHKGIDKMVEAYKEEPSDTFV